MTPDSLLDWPVSADDVGLRLDKFLAAPARLRSRPRAADAIERGRVFLNGTEVSLREAGRQLVAGDVIGVWLDRPGSARRRAPVRTGALDILYEDSALVVVNKPAGLLSVPLQRRSEADSVYELLKDYLRSRGQRRPFVVHRINRDTSGLVLFAKDTRAQAQLKEQFRRREPERVYWAFVYGCPNPPSGTWIDHIVWDTNALIQKETSTKNPRAAEAVCHYRVIEAFRDTSWIEVRLETGKRNRIRLQARLRGHTLIGERRYIYGPQDLRPIPFPRQALHAWTLSFRHPETGAPLVYEAPLPDDMGELLERLRAAR